MSNNPSSPQAGPSGAFCGLKPTELASQLQALREHICLLVMDFFGQPKISITSFLFMDGYS